MMIFYFIVNHPKTQEKLI